MGIEVVVWTSSSFSAAACDLVPSASSQAFRLFPLLIAEVTALVTGGVVVNVVAGTGDVHDTRGGKAAMLGDAIVSCALGCSEPDEANTGNAGAVDNPVGTAETLPCGVT